MKKNIHPTMHPVVFVDISTGDEIVTTSTLTSDKTKSIDGVDHYIIECDVTSFSHPFFTGEQRFVDRQGRVDKFMKRMQAAQNAPAQAKKAVTKSADKDTKSYQQILREQQQKLRTAQKTNA